MAKRKIMDDNCFDGKGDTNHCSQLLTWKKTEKGVKATLLIFSVTVFLTLQHYSFVSNAYHPTPHSFHSLLRIKTSGLPKGKPKTLSSSGTRLNAVSNRKVVVYDGAEWNAINKFLSPSRFQVNPPTKFGTMTIVTGTTTTTTDGGEANRRVVGVVAHSISEEDMASYPKLNDETYLYPQSVAVIPRKVKDDDAMSTMVASLSSIHCSLPRVENKEFVNGTVVVLGGGDFACFASDGVAALGGDVVLVTTGKARPKNKNVKVMSPSVGDLELGFASVINQFDSLVDTIGDESNIGKNDNDATLYRSSSGMSNNDVISELKTRHSCDRYISTMTKAQRIVVDEGVVFGPGKAKTYLKDIAGTAAMLSNIKGKRERKEKAMLVAGANIVPPNHFGLVTVQTLLDKGIIFPAGSMKGSVFMRGWSLKDFWENTSWPRDSAGGGNVRFGLPVVDDLETPYSGSSETTYGDQYSDEDDEYADLDLASLAMKQLTIPTEDFEGEASTNSFVMDIDGVASLNQHILDPKIDCILFLSAPFCRTCRMMSPRYTRMARIAADDRQHGSIKFAKANAVGKLGKELGRVLDVASVPSFVMFRGGKVYGSTLSVTRLPSKKLDLAVDYLANGMEWDVTAFRDLDK